jgi:hypothetical protein
MASINVSGIIERCIRILADKGYTTNITTETLTEQKKLTIDIVKTDTREPAATITACASTCEISEGHTHNTRSDKLNMEINSINVNWVNTFISKQQLGQLSIILAVLILYSNTNNKIVTLDNDSDLSGIFDKTSGRFTDIYSKYFNFKYKYTDYLEYDEDISQEAINSFIPDVRPPSDFMTFSQPSTQASEYTQSQCSSCSSGSFDSDFSDYSTVSEDMTGVKLGGPDMLTDIYDFIDKCIIILDDIQEQIYKIEREIREKNIKSTRILRSATAKAAKGIFSNKSKKKIRRKSNKPKNKPNNKTKKKIRKKRV